MESDDEHVSQTPGGTRGSFVPTPGPQSTDFVPPTPGPSSAGGSFASPGPHSGAGSARGIATPSSHPMSTPRGDLGSSTAAAYRRSPGPSSGGVGPTSDGAPFSEDPGRSSGDYPASSDLAHQTTMVWGTTINLNVAVEQVKSFLQTFLETETQEPLYPRLLEQAKTDESYNLNIDAMNLKEHDEAKGHNLYRQLVRYPQEMVPIFDLVVFEEFTRLYDEEGQRRFQVRVFNLSAEHTKSMRQLNPENIDTLVAVEGMIVRTSSIIPDLKQAFFECNACAHSMTVAIDRGRISEPSACPKCAAKHSMRLIHNRCLFTDKQVVKMQEAPEAIPPGETPATVTICAYDDLVDHAKPGDRVVVTGVYRATPMRVSPRLRTVKSVFRTYLDVIHFKKHSSSRFGAEDARAAKGSEYAAEVEERDAVDSVLMAQEEAMKAMGRDPEIYSKLVRSLAPSIYELDDVKKGVLCQLFGGTNKTLGESGAKCRGELNVLLCGDPGTAKSQILNYVHKIAPRGVYTSGKGSSAVGLTAYVTKDPDTKEFVLESGALVLSDRGICCIDEFDKMSDETRAVLHEAMEQQTVSIAKAGIICSLNARTSILAGANPIESRYNARKSVVENINIPPTLLSRFDLIYLILDKPDEASDTRLARHLVSLYFKEPTRFNNDYAVPKLTQFITYAKKNCSPRLTDDAVEALVDKYVEMRQAGTAQKTVTATPRQLESLIRLAEAHARMHLSNLVTRANVEEAVRLVQSATLRAATNPETGEIDMDLITTGQSASMRGRIDDLADELRAVIADRRQRDFRARDIVDGLREKMSDDVANDDVRLALDSLVREGEVIEVAQGSYRKA